MIIILILTHVAAFVTGGLLWGKFKQVALDKVNQEKADIQAELDRIKSQAQNTLKKM